MRTLTLENSCRVCLAVVASTLFIASCAVSLSAQTQAAPGADLIIGSRNVASVEPPVSRPAARPCSVTLFEHEAFNDHGDGSSMEAHPHQFKFVPPHKCDGAWDKVVLEADFSVPAGRQYDRTVAIWLGAVNLYFGTTMEPQPDVPIHWHVERDLTDYSALFRQKHPGQIVLNNWISTETNQPIYVTAKLLFFPAREKMPASYVADRIYPMSSDAEGREQVLQSQNESLSHTFTFPRNVESAYLDVIAQSQAFDERWYTCVEKRYLERTRDYSLESFEACDGGSFRGVEVLLDGKPAGLAPVSAWIFAGGIAPHLWLPTPGIQTLSFIPFRVDLSPFAGILDDGKPHSVSVRVLGANRFFNVAANLLIYQDHASAELSGKLLENTLSAAQPAGLTVSDTLHHDETGRIVGTIHTNVTQAFLARGVLHTSHGEVTTTVHYAANFRNHATFARPGEKQYDETIDQSNDVSIDVVRDLNGKLLSRMAVKQKDPLMLAWHKTMVTTGQDFTALVTARQGHEITLRRTSGSGRIYNAHLNEELESRDRADGVNIPPPLDRTDFDHQEAGQETVQFKDSLGSCYQAEIESRAERLTAMQVGIGCVNGRNHLGTRSRPGHPWLLPLDR
ncbi:MAG: hypothetical protein KGN79_10510 [Acidobacteriota bacterium]|nr:hypothetical protein [Acidobacteriota bacterium]